MSIYVLDTSAIFSFLDDEAGAEIVENLLIKASHKKVEIIIPWTCIGEVYYITKLRKGIEEAKRIVGIIKGFPAKFLWI